MIKGKKKRHKIVYSLKLRLLLVIIFSLSVAAVVFVSVRSGIIRWVENSYNAPEAKQERLDGYMHDLQEYVYENKLSSRDTAQITRWLRGTRNVYLFLYKDNQLFFTGGIEDEEEEKPGDTDGGETDKDGENTEGDITDGEGGENTEPDGDGGDEGNTDTPPADEEGGDSTEDGDGDEGTAGDGSDENGDEAQAGTGGGTQSGSQGSSQGGQGSSRPNTGITVTYPTKEEILQHAAYNGLKPLELSDGTLLASFVDFSDYFYYNLSNVVSILAALLLVVIMLMIYFQGITFKISRLAEDVSDVYTEDMHRQIRTSDGKDEISELTRNVEEMRRSMLEGLQKEREALDANSELITSMSHDIRTPLTVLLGYLDLMKTYPVNEELGEYIRASENTALRLKELSDDMFRYFLVFGGKELEVSITDYDARTLLDQLLSEHILLLRERGFTVEWDINIPSDEQITVSTDAPKLMRVVDNIFSNIHKYAEATCPIVFSAKKVGGVLRIEIENRVKDVAEAESNGVGLRTCMKICEALDITFNYGVSENENGERIYTSLLELKAGTGGKE